VHFQGPAVTHDPEAHEGTKRWWGPEGHIEAELGKGKEPGGGQDTGFKVSHTVTEQHREPSTFEKAAGGIKSWLGGAKDTASEQADMARDKAGDLSGKAQEHGEGILDKAKGWLGGAKDSAMDTAGNHTF
jgi:hypothetical protein